MQLKHCAFRLALSVCEQWVNDWFPSECPLCSQPAEGLAGWCRAHDATVHGRESSKVEEPNGLLTGQEDPWLDGNRDRARAGTNGRCARCDLELPRGLPDGYTCAVCRRTPPAFARILSQADWRAAAGLREAVVRWKHSGARHLTWPLAWQLAECWRKRTEAGERQAVFVPVPLHRARVLERGFDQALELARHLGDYLELPCANALVRTRWTAPQGGPGSRSRQANVSGAFAVKSKVKVHLKGRRIWLVDDVVTSGSTSNECARVLKRSGASWVGVLCLARAGRQRASFERKSEPFQ